jgi:hypothetical protein
MAQFKFELKLADGKTVEWDGETGEDAAVRAADCLGVEVVAWRWPRYGIHVGIPYEA